jgi:hypothetical protein
MARGGIYKSEVIRARTTLLSQGIYPSIDAVRQELGNTGSKATIHRYLKEIGEEEGGKTGGKRSVKLSRTSLHGWPNGLFRKGKAESLSWSPSMRKSGISCSRR